MPARRGAGARRRHRCRAGARRRPRAAGRRAHHHKGQRRPGRLRHHQRPEIAKGLDRHRRRPHGARPDGGRRRAAGAHQRARVLLPLVHQQPAARPHAQPAQRGADTRRLVRRRGQRGGGRVGRHRARHRHCRLRPLPGLRLRRARPAAEPGAGGQLQRHGAQRPQHRRADHGRVRSAGAHRGRPAPGPGGHGAARHARPLVRARAAVGPRPAAPRRCLSAPRRHGHRARDLRRTAGQRRPPA